MQNVEKRHKNVTDSKFIYLTEEQFDELSKKEKKKYLKEYNKVRLAMYESGNKKFRYFWVVVYPKYLPDDWFTLLNQSGLSGELSPLHDMDKNATGELKKTHYHLLLMSEHPITARTFMRKLLECTQTMMPFAPKGQKVEDLKGAHRYLTHADNPEKFQYDAKDLKVFGGFTARQVEKLKRGELEEMKDQLTNEIFEKEIYEFHEYVNDLRKSGQILKAQTLRDNYGYFKSVIDSKRFSLKDKLKETQKEIEKSQEEVRKAKMILSLFSEEEIRARLNELDNEND